MTEARRAQAKVKADGRGADHHSEGGARSGAAWAARPTAWAQAGQGGHARCARAQGDGSLRGRRPRRPTKRKRGAVREERQIEVLHEWRTPAQQGEMGGCETGGEGSS